MAAGLSDCSIGELNDRSELRVGARRASAEVSARRIATAASSLNSSDNAVKNLGRESIPVNAQTAATTLIAASRGFIETEELRFSLVI
jgi:hypothetical protein